MHGHHASVSFSQGVYKGSVIAALADVGAAMERPISYQARIIATSPEEGGPGLVADR